MEPLPSPAPTCPNCGRAFDPRVTGEWFEKERAGHPVYEGYCQGCNVAFRAYGRTGAPVADLTWEAALPSMFGSGGAEAIMAHQLASELVGTIRNTHVEAKCRRLFRLGQIGRAANAAVPAVLEALHDPAEAVLQYAMGWDPPAEEFHYVRHAAVIALHAISPEHMPLARPVMIELDGRPLYHNCNITPTPADLEVEFPQEMWEAAGGKPTTAEPSR